MRTREREFYLTRLADATVTPSSYEQAVLNEAVPGAKVAVLPIVREIPGRRNPFKSRSDIAFIGGYLHQPNVDALVHFLDCIWPLIHAVLPDVKFRALGADMPTELATRTDPGFLPVGYQEDLRPALEELRLLVAPLRYGAGGKGKIITGMVHGVPCVATPVAAEGMGLADGEAIAIAVTDANFAQQVIGLYNDESRWTEMSDAALAAARNCHSLEVGLAKFRDILISIGAPVPLRGVPVDGDAFR